MSLSDLLERGYFPKELPAPFVTKPFADVVSRVSPLPEDFGKQVTRNAGIPSAKPTRYSLARGGLLRRQLSLCNPVLFYLLARETIDNWPTLSPHLGGTQLSATAPVFMPDGRAIQGVKPQNARAELAQATRLGRRFILTTDISRFYHSIYTHSIPWALHTKSTAKRNYGFNLLGNKLDFLVRQGQDRQTGGIPIGPDTSLMLSELIMQECDNELLAKMPNIKGHRFIDDYELSFATRTEAEDAFHILESCLGDYELALNTKKTSVAELPLPLEPKWVSELKKFSFRPSRAGQAADLEGYFNRAFELHGAFFEEAVLQFALARLRYEVIHPENWELFQRLVLLCVVPEPATLPYALEQILSRVNSGAIPSSREIEDIVNQLVVNHSPRRHTSEVANALWACLALQLTLHEEAVDAVSQYEDSCIALLALDCRNRGFLSKPLDTSIWESCMTADGLYDDQWLLAYEANYKRWLPSVDGIDHVAADRNFGFLKANGVYFYDEMSTTIGTGQVPLPNLPTIRPGIGMY